MNDWPALAAARRHDAAARLPFVIGGVQVGSVARSNLQPLLALESAGAALALIDGAVTLHAHDRDAALAHINAELRSRGLVEAWRDERVDLPDPERPATVLARIERAAARFWGTLTLGAHANAYVADRTGRPTHLWIAQRSFVKPTDPGLYDNAVGGGVGAGDTPARALLREAWEEAGLADVQASGCHRVIRLQRDVPHGLQLEDLHAFDIRLSADVQLRNQDGEVHAFSCLPVAQALALAAGDTMTVDAALVTLDFALRHGLLPAGEAAALQPRLQALFSPGD